MSEDKVYKDGDIVWVKLGNNWWPGEVTGPNRHPEGLIKHLKRVPYCVVKFFNENTYEYVRSSKQIFPFQCAKQEEFIRKGYSLYNSGNSFMEKFPNDVEVAKRLTRRKETSLIINDRPDSIVKAILGQPLIRTCDDGYYDGTEYREKRRSGDSVTKILNITQNRNDESLNNEKNNTKTSLNSLLNLPNNKTKNVAANTTANNNSNNNSNYQCNLCDFTSVRQNVMILHRKMHSNRNSLGSSNNTIVTTKTNTTAAVANIKASTPATATTSVATTTNVNNNNNKKQLQQNQIVNKGKTITNKTKASTITITAATTKTRTSKSPPTPVKELAVTTPVNEINVENAEADETAITPKEKNNRFTRLQQQTTTVSATKPNKSKTGKKLSVKEKKEESAYATILSDFCPSETETSPSSEENQSRRSLRNGKHLNDNTVGKATTICIDLLEPKTIQKIPKKREYTSLQVQKDPVAEVTLSAATVENDPDVVCLVDKEKEAANTTTISSKSKKDAEDIRRMLLADWSDDDETPTDAIVVEDSIVTERTTENNECITVTQNKQNSTEDLFLTSTPLHKPTPTTSIGRIRNIPKKDRRDIVLQDFNSDLSAIQSDKEVMHDNANKSVAVDLDSSNSSIVEIIEDEQPATIITINDDEEHELTKSQKNSNNVIVNETKDPDSAVGVVLNEKCASAATSTTTLSCFDFQEDEDEQDANTPTIPHFKKKYLSGDKLQNLSSASHTEELKDDMVAKNRAELAEKDQRLAAEIESLLEQTQPPVADLLNTNSFEESMSVKDLPIKERGKRIFKSRNKTRLDDKINADTAATATQVDNTSMATLVTTDLNKSDSENAINVQEIVIDDMNNDKNEQVLKSNAEIINNQKLSETDQQDNSENISNTNYSIENSNQEFLNPIQAEIPKYLEDTPNENKENVDSSVENKDTLELPNGEHNPADISKEQVEIENKISAIVEENNDKEESIENVISEQNDMEVNCEDSCKEQNASEQPPTNDSIETEEETEQENLEIPTIEKDPEVSKEVKNVEEIELNREGIESSIDNNPNTNSESLTVSEYNEPTIATVNNEEIRESQSTEDFPLTLENNLNSKQTSKEKEIPESFEETLINDKEELIKPTETHINHQEVSENLCKIRVKSPDQLFDQAFVMTAQQDQELQPIIDNNMAETRLNTTTPTDENSSMGASDTGAEFGSPTSMLSEERLPAFRFQSNQTPQPEIESSESLLHEETLKQIPNEVKNEVPHKDVSKNEANGINKDHFLKDVPQIYGRCNQKQRRFSMDLDSLQTEPKLCKRQRLSVDEVTTNQKNNFEKSPDILKPITLFENKIGRRIRPKSRHVKITPRRNVSELFKSQKSIENHISKDVQKSGSIESVKESENVKEVVDEVEKVVENRSKNNDQNVVENDVNSNEKLRPQQEVEEMVIEKQKMETKQGGDLEGTLQSEVSVDNCLDKISGKDYEQENVVNDQLEVRTKPLEEKTDTNNEMEVDTEVTSEKVHSPINEPILEKEDMLEATNSLGDQQNETKLSEDRDISNSEEKETANEDSNKLQQTVDDIKTPVTNILKDTTDTSNPGFINIENSLITVEEVKESETNKTIDDEKSENTDEEVKVLENNKIIPDVMLSPEKAKIQNEQGLDIPYSPGVPPPTPQEREVIIESETQNQTINAQPPTLENVGAEAEITIKPVTPKDKENLDEINNEPFPSRNLEQNLNEISVSAETPNKQKELNEEIRRPITPKETKKDILNEDHVRPITPKESEPTSPSKTLAEPLTPQQMSQDICGNFENNIVMPSTPQDSYVEEDTENPTPTTPQVKDLIIESEPSTPQGIIECDHSVPTQVTPEKEVIVESDIVLATPPSVTQDKDIIIEENLQLEEKDSLIEREFQVIPPKEIPPTAGSTVQEPQSNTLQTDAEKAAEEFLIEFDSIVNHSHSVEEDAANTSVEDVINTDDLINNIIEEVHDDQQFKQDVPTTIESPIQYEPMTTFTVVTPKNSWNQIFKESFNRQLTPAKRRQTICFEISDMKEGVACKKQALDFESVLPVNKTIKRTAERKLTLPAIETKLSNSLHHQQNILALNHTPITLNKKLIPRTKRKLSIEDNITSFIIERPKQAQQATTTNIVAAASSGGPPPLQRIRPLSRQGQANTKTTVDNLTEPPPLQSHDNIFNELFRTESSSPTSNTDVSQKPEGGRVIHQQILNPPNISSIPQNRATEAKISKNKQIGVDSRGNKYVIIKTPPTDIIVQPTLTSSTAAAVTATNNFGTTITIQPIARSSSDSSVNKVVTKNKNVAATAASPLRKQQQQQPQVQQMKQISITVPAKSPVEISKTTEVVAKTPQRNRRKGAHAKAITTAATTANSNINSAKHRQAMEALSRRLSIASEAPPLAKISRTPSTHVQTQLSNNSNLTFFADTQISNIAQQQLMQLQQQQQQQQQTTTLPPPIILNKNAHQQSVLPRKARKISQHQQQQQQHHHLQQQTTANAVKSSQLLHQLQQNQLQQQQQQIQQQFITQIPTQQQPQQQQHHSLQTPPLQQIQTQTVQVQQQQQQQTQQIVQQNEGIIITTNATEDDNVIDSNTQLIALPTQPYPGYSETFLLCKVKGNTCKPVDNVPLYLNHQLNELVPVPLEALEGGRKQQERQIEMKATNTTQQLLANQNNATQNSEGNNLQMTNLNCNIVEGEISAGIETEHQSQQQQQQHQIMEECVVDNDNVANSGSNQQINDFGGTQDVNTELISNNGILLNIEGQQVLLDAATFAHLLANPDANTQLISDDGTEYVLTHEVLAALQMQQEQQQALELANAAAAEQQQQQQQQQRHLEQTGGNDIIAVALAGSELYDNEVLTIDTSQGMQLIDGDGSIVFPAQQTGAITQQHLTPPAVVTNAVLDQSPIMSTLEVPSSIAPQHKLQGSQLITVPSHHLATSTNAVLGMGGRSNLEDSLAAIGVTTQSSSIPSSLGLPITVTNPNIASKVTSAGPLNEMLQFVSHRPATAAATAAAVAAAALAGESRIFTD